MHDQPETVRPPKAVEHDLRRELAGVDLSPATVQPVLRHLLCNDEPVLFGDAVIARIRGMVGDIARQLLETQAETAGVRDLPGIAAEQGDMLASRLSGDDGLLGHVHAIALEGLLLDRLSEGGIDPVVPPVVVDLAAGKDGEAAALAMQVLAAQARFVQYHHRMALPLGDLPAEIFHAALLVHGDEASGQRLRAAYDERAGRVALATRLAMALGSRADRGLAIEHVGGSTFASALALASGQPRDLVIALLTTRSGDRVALALRAAGLSSREIEAQLALLQPRTGVPAGIDGLDAKRAGALVADLAVEARN